MNQWLPPGAPPIPDPDASMDYSLTASGRVGPRNAIAGTAVAWDFGRSWAADLPLELATSCTGPDCEPESILISGAIPGLAQSDAFPCATTVECEGANLDDPTIPN